MGTQQRNPSPVRISLGPCGSAGAPATLGTFDAVVIGLGSMIGAGIFVALGPAAAAAGGGLLIGLGAAAVVAYRNATSSARLAARYPQSGGTYVYAASDSASSGATSRAQRSFIVGKTASCAAMALTVGFYAWPAQAHAVAVGAVVGLTAVNYRGIQKSALLTRIVVATVLAVLAAVVVIGGAPGMPTPVVRLAGGSVLGCCRRRACCSSPSPAMPASRRWVKRCASRPDHPAGDPDRAGAHAARVRGGGATLIAVLGTAGLAAAPAPLADAVRAAGRPGSSRWSGPGRRWRHWVHCCR